MSQVEITVRGEHVAFHPPERGTVHLTVALEGPQEAAVHRGVADALGEVTGSISPLHDPQRGPVTWWASDQLRTSARRPWNKDGKQLPLVFSARADVQAKFSDFSALSRWVGQVLTIQGVKLDRIEWALTEVRKRQLTHRVRTEAVGDAARKAQVYADALGLGDVVPVALADAGMLGQGLDPAAGGQAVAFARGAAAPSSAEVAFAPQDIQVSATVDARFLAG
ncbi:DUF541 domain-containing protein [Auraticoccus sp. F435]|uniref:DUF541 domain-containing protein n=1 Tax=Auraticoccus cholistanensis TaxID=2656650 RepID=A0A6A9UZU2_9ACTN|nr:SIMPL domain-containing protein [Auraticoccus cholistanensis]MVA74429.1 DUF541 domain-containing protein [Auraticoccus cholistanensis]